MRMGGWSKSFLLAIGIFAALVFISAAVAFAANEAQLATLQLTVNKVEVQRGGKGAWSEAKAPLPLYLGDRVRTLRKARAAILFVDGSEIMLNQDTMMEVSSSYDTEKKGLINQVRIFLGEVFNKVSPQKDSNVQFKTPDAVATVRGTRFSIFTRPSQTILPEDIPDYSFDTWSRLNKGYRTRLAVQEGLVDFFNQLGSVMVGALQISESGWNIAPSTPLTVPLEELQMQWVHELEQQMQSGNANQHGEDNGETEPGGKKQGGTDEGKQAGEQAGQAEQAGQSKGPTATLPLIPTPVVTPKLTESLVANCTGFSPLAQSPNNCVSWSGVVQPVTAWQFVIKNEKGAVVRTFTANNAQVKVEWDGKDEKKVQVPDGVYTATLVIKATSAQAAASFTAPSVIVDTKAPQVQIKSPLPGSTLKQIVNIEAVAVEVNLAKWSMQIDEAQPFFTNTSGKIQATLDTTQLSNGVHQIKVTVVDIAGHETTASIIVHVANAIANIPQDRPNMAGLELMLLGQAVGVLSATNGQVEVQRKGDSEWKPAALSDALFPEDRLRTAGKSVAMIFFADNSMLVVNENTTIEFDKRQELTHPLGEVITARICVGEVFVTINSLETQLEVAGPDTTVSSDGASFLFSVQPGSAQQLTARLIILEGRALFVNRMGSVMVEQMQESTSTGDQQPSKPQLINGLAQTDWLNKLGK